MGRKVTTMTITMRQAIELYRAANNAGHGYALDGETVEDAAAGSDGTTVLKASTTSEVTVVRVGDTLVAIGGDAMGRNPWACDIGRV
jgi:hypothetical protein